MQTVQGSSSLYQECGLLFWSYEFGLLLGIALVIRMRSVMAQRPHSVGAKQAGRGWVGKGPEVTRYQRASFEAPSSTRNDLFPMGLKEVSREGQEQRLTRPGTTQKPEGVGTMANFNEQQNDGGNERKDQAWPGQYRLGFGSEHVGDVMWRCRVLRAGQLYSTSLFATKDEADEFARKLGETEPEKMFNVEAIKAASVWN